MARHLETLIAADQAARASSVIARAPREDGVPASIAQERLWKLQRVLPGMPLFNILYPLRLTSAFDAPALERSLNEIVRRHEILRTTFRCLPGITIPLQFISDDSILSLQNEDLSDLENVLDVLERAES